MCFEVFASLKTRSKVYNIYINIEYGMEKYLFKQYKKNI